LSFRAPHRLKDEAFFDTLFDEAARRRGLDTSASAEPAPILDDEAGPDPDAEDLEPLDEGPARREGLPADFQMRHDAHYVDQIVSRRAGEPIHLIAISEIDGPHPVTAARELQPLVQSVARFGVLQPLLVRRHAGRYQLIAGSRRLAAAMAAGLSEVPCLIYFADEEKARALADAEGIHVRHEPSMAAETDAPPVPAAAFADLTEHLGAIGACLHLFGDRERPLRERIALGLIQAEVQRAAWLSQALGVLAGDPLPAGNRVDLSVVVQRIVAALTPERVLAGVEFETVVPSEAALVRGDEPLCALAVAGLIATLQPLIERIEGARIRVAVRKDADAKAIEVEASQDVAAMPAAWRARFLDRAWPERPGGHRAAVMLAAAARVAELHDGALTFPETGGRGCRLVLAFPMDR
jgi:hypothetical protein